MIININFILLLAATALCFVTTTAEKLSTGEDVAAYVTRKIEESDVMIFAKSYCPHCKASRKLMHKLRDDADHSWTLDVVDMDLMEEEDGPFIQMELMKQSGQKTVPNVFIHGSHVGGNSDLQALYNSGELSQMLAQVEL
ncbi:hypothetical protein MPSEU_000299800 [Mayamaea pseudoterrestris]|nr:hypothetical protein MPSEU_000299800 [Mayamaea pseudoterrestris]